MSIIKLFIDAFLGEIYFFHILIQYINNFVVSHRFNIEIFTAILFVLAVGTKII